MSISLIILTLNEIEGVKIMIPKVKQEWADEIVLVDGGSTDGTIEEVKRLGLKIINQKTKITIDLRYYFWFSIRTNNMDTYIVFDLETNGIGKFRAPTHTITQIGFIKFKVF